MLSKSTRIPLFLFLLMLFLMTGSAHLSARSSLAMNRSLRPATSLVQATAEPPPSTGRAPRVAQPTDGSIDSLLSPLSTNAAFAMEIYPNEYMRYIPNTDTLGEWLYVGDLAGTAYFAGDFVGGDFSQMYVIDYNLNELHSLDTATAADATIGACNPISGQVWTGATGTADGILYASSTDGLSSTLYTVDIATGTATSVGEITNASEIIDIAINADGEMYGVDISSDSLVQIDPVTGAGTVIGSIGFDADYAQGMDFEEVSGVLYLAAFNATTSQGELRIANTATGNSVLVGAFPDGAETDALAFTPPPTQLLQNPDFESGWAYWQAEGIPFLSSNSHSGSTAVSLNGEEDWVWQEVSIPADAIDVSIGYWLTGLSSDPEWDNDILCGGIWDQTRQTDYGTACFGLTYFYHYLPEWRYRVYRLDADELANVAGQRVSVGFRLTQDWVPGYSQTSSASVDDAALYVTRPIYDYAVYLPLAVR